MIKEALQYIVGLSEAKTQEINGQVYSDKDLSRISYNPKAAAISMSTLTSLVDYIKAGIDKMSDKMIIQVVDPLTVRLISMLDDERKREVLVEVTGQVPQITFNRYIDRESFNIALQSKFIHDDNVALLLKFVGTVQSESVAAYGDDGVSQKATIRKGIAGSQDALVPNPVVLRPYRTFMEVEQPASSFVFRIKEDRDIECAIFEADGGAWKNAAMQNIKDYLEYELSEYKQFTVIS